MNKNVFRLVWSKSLKMLVAAPECAKSGGKKSARSAKRKALVLSVLTPLFAQAQTSFLDFTSGLAGWTVVGSAQSYTVANSGITPPAGQTMVKILTASNATTSSQAETAFGLSSGALAAYNAANYGYIQKDFTLTAGSYAFQWNYKNTDAGFPDGALFALSGSGGNQVIGLARNESTAGGSVSVNSGVTLGWTTTTFNISSSGTYKLSFAEYNGLDNAADPLFTIAGTAAMATNIAGGTKLAAGLAASPATLNPVFDGGTLQLDGTALGSAYTFSITANHGSIDLNNQTASIGTAISGSGNLTIGGSGGSLTLGATNTYTGATNVTGGTLNLTGSLASTSVNVSNGATLTDSNGGLASGTNLTNNGTVNVNASQTIANLNGTNTNANTAVANTKTLTVSGGGSYAGAVTGQGGLTISGGTQTLSGTNTYTGATNVTGGTLDLTGSLASTSVNVSNGATLTDSNGGLASSTNLTNDGTVNVNASQTIANLNGTNTNANTAVANTKTLTVSGGGSYAGQISGSGGLSISGGTQILSGTSTYTGQTTIANGATLVIADANGGIGATSSVVDNGTLTFSRTNNVSFNIDISGSGELIKTGAGSLTLSNQAGYANTYSGGTKLNQGTLIVSANENLGATASKLTMASGTTLNTTATFDNTHAVALTSGSATFSVNNATTLTQSGSISGAGALVKDGTGTLILSGDNSGNHALGKTAGNGWQGGLTVNAGLVQVTNGWGLGWGDVTVNGGTINTTVNIETGQTIALAGGTTVNTDAGTTTTLTGTISTGNAGPATAFIKDGTGTLKIDSTSSATLSHGVDVQKGILTVDGALNTGGSGITVQSGATLQGMGTITANTVQVQANGILRGTGTITGLTTVAGTLKPGNSPGFMQVNSTTTMLNGSTYQSDIAGKTQASATSTADAGYYSYLHVAGAGNQFVINNGATLAPTLQNLFVLGEPGFVTTGGNATWYTPSVGDSFRIVTADGGISGRFTSLTQPTGMASNTRFVAFYNMFGSNSVDLKVLPSSYARWLSSENKNVVSAGSALDRMIALTDAGTTTAAQDQLLYVTAGKTAAALPAFVKALSGEVHGAQAATLSRSAFWLQDSVARHLASDNTQDEGQPVRTLWMDMVAENGHVQSDGTSSGFSTDRYQTAIGSDLWSTGKNRIGVGASYAQTNLKTINGSGSSNEATAFAYGQYGIEGMQLDGAATYGFNDNTTKRNDPTGLSASAFNTNFSGQTASIGSGVRFPLAYRDMNLVPFARVTYQNVNRNGYSEGGTPAALTVHSQNLSGTRAVAGISGGSLEKNPLKVPTTYQFSLGAGYDEGNLIRPKLRASLAGIDTQIAAPSVGRGFVQANITATVRLAPYAYAFVGLSGEERSGSGLYGVNAGLRANF